MPREYGRNRRVADVIQRELAPLLHRHEEARALGLITISAVDVSPDLRNARVFVTILANERGQADSVLALNAMVGYFRRHLAKELSLRVVPRLEFVFDESIERGEKMSALIDSLADGGK